MNEADDQREARALLVKLVANEGAFTPGVAIALAKMLCHIAGGDGRGVYTIKHNLLGDRIRGRR